MKLSNRRQCPSSPPRSRTEWFNELQNLIVTLPPQRRWYGASFKRRSGYEAPLGAHRQSCALHRKSTRQEAATRGPQSPRTERHYRKVGTILSRFFQPTFLAAVIEPMLALQHDHLPHDWSHSFCSVLAGVELSLQKQYGMTLKAVILAEIETELALTLSPQDLAAAKVALMSADD